jgi:hypothetical protein
MQTQYYCYRYPINTTDFPVVKVHVDEYRVLEFGDINSMFKVRDYIYKGNLKKGQVRFLDFFHS